MPKVKGTFNKMFQKINNVYPGVFKYNQDFEVYCLLCARIVHCRKWFSIDQHCNTNKHQLAAANFDPPDDVPNAMEYDFEVSKCFMEADIPLSKMEHPSISALLTKYTQQTQPNLATLQLRVPKLYKSAMKRLQTLVQEEYIWTSLDYIVDADGRLIANFIFGILDPNGVGREKCYLLNTMLVDVADEIASLSAFFIDSLTLLWPQGIQYHKVMVCVTGADSNMIEVIDNLKGIFPKMLHITCFAQSFHRIAEYIRKCYPNVNSLISNTNTGFLMAPYHRYLFKKTCPKLPLPPNPCITRWCTWLRAAIYYADNHTVLKNIVSEFKDEDAEAIIEAKRLFNSNEIQADLNLLKRDFSVLVKGAERLEQKGLNLQEIMTVVENVFTSLSSIEKKLYFEKLQTLFQKTDGYNCLLAIHNALYEDCNDADHHYIAQLTKQELALFKYCPVSVYHAERIFPLYSQLFNSQIRMLRFESLKQNLIIYSNNLNDLPPYS